MPLDPISRRTMLQRSAATGLSFAFASWLAACGGVEGENEGQGASTTATQPASVDHPKTEFATVAFANWPLYIDKAVIKDFNKEFDTELKYTEEINDNDEYFAKVRQELEAGKPIGRDLVALTDYMVARWIESGFVEPIDQDNVPNMANLVDGLRDVPFDPGRKFSLPWQSGMTAIGYDPERTGGELTSVNAFFDPKFKGKVSFLSDWRDAGGLTLLTMGKDPRKATKDDMMAAIDKIEQANADGQIRRFTGNDYTGDLTKGNLDLAMAWSGDVIQLQADNPNLRFLIPEEGAMLWSDNMMMPKGVAEPYGAETFMNYVYQPEVAAKIAAYVNYVSPVKGAQEILAKTDPELAENPLIFPDAETQARLYPHPNYTPDEEQEISARWVEVTGG